MAKEFIYCKSTDIRFYEGDIVILKNKPKVKWIVHHGWFIFGGVQNFDWYLSSITKGETLPVSNIDLTLLTLATTRTVGSELYDGKTVNYTRPFTDNDADAIARSFITVDTVEQRDNLDPKTLVNGKIVRVNNFGGDATYYAWNENTKAWDLVDFGGGGGSGVYYDTTANWNKNPKLIGKRGCIYVYSDYKKNEEGQDIAGIKIGDGLAYLIDSPFTDEILYKHIEDKIIHITQAEREFWNNKTRCYVNSGDPEHIIFTTH